MKENQKDGLSEALETGSAAAHTIRGALKAGKAISGAAKGTAAGGLYGAAAGALWEGRKYISKIIIAVIVLLLLPVLFILMLPSMIFGGLTEAFSPADPNTPDFKQQYRYCRKCQRNYLYIKWHFQRGTGKCHYPN